MAELMTLVNRGLPASTSPAPTAIQGQDLQGKMPNLLNRLVPPKARPEES